MNTGDDAETSVGDRAAGDLSSWLALTREIVRDGGDADVACNGCTACCESSQFVHIGPDETDAIAHIPDGLLFAAPGLPTGHRLMGYDERGQCPMLVEGACSIYDHRPRTCRAFDCRVFAATGVAPDEDKPAIAAAAGRWRFDMATAQAEAESSALRAAGEFVARHRADELFAATGTAQLGVAVTAVQIYEHFLSGPRSDADVLADVVSARDIEHET